MDFLELQSIYDHEQKIEFRYVFQHVETLELMYDVYSMEEIVSGMVASIMHSDDYKKYKLLGYDMWSGLYDRRSRKIYVNDILKHKNVRKYSNTSDVNQRFLVSWGHKTTDNNKIVAAGCIFKPIDIDEYTYTLFNTKYDTEIVGNTWKGDSNYKKENYTVNI